jgi:GAF domain-containing protein
MSESREELEARLAALTRALEASETRFLNIVTQNTDGILIVDHAGTIQFANPAAAALFGRPTTELIGSPFAFPLTLDEPTEIDLPNSSWGPLTVELRVSAHLWDGQRARLVMARDVTTRKRADMRLRLAGREHRLLAEALRDTATALNSTLDVTEVFDRLLTNAARVVPHDTASIMLIEGEVVRTMRTRGFVAHGLKEYALQIEVPLASLPVIQRILETQQPLIIPNTYADPDWYRFPDMEWIQAYLGAPIISRGQVIGVINLDSTTLGFFTADHAERLMAFANHAAIAIENARLFQNLSTEKRRLELLYNLSQNVTASLEPREVADRALHLMTQALGASMGELFIHDPGTQRLRFIAVSGFDSASVEALNQKYPNISINAGYGLAGWVAQKRLPTLVVDVTRDPRWAPTGLEDHIRSAASVPLLTGDELMGVISLLSERVGAFTSADLPLLAAASTPIALALQNARLFEERTQALAREQRLGAVTRAISSSLDLPILLRDVVRLAIELTNAEAAMLGLVDEESGSIQPTYSVHLPDPLPMPAPAPEGQSLAWGVIDTGEPLIIRDYASHPRAQAGLVAFGVKEVLGVPMVAGREAIGILALYVLDARRHFSERDLVMAELVARQAGVAIQNARFFESAQQRAAELEALYRASATLFSATDLRTLAEQIVAAVVEEFDQTHCTVMLLDEQAHELRPVAQSDQTDFVAFAMRLYGPGMIPEAARTGEAIYAPDVSTDPHYLRGNPATRSEFAIPLRAGGRVIGVLNLESPELDALSRRERRTLMAFAERAGLALQNALLFSATELNARHMGLLNAITRAAIETRDFNTMLQTLVERVRTVIDGDSATITLWDSARHQPIPGAATHSLREIYHSAKPLPGEPTITEAVIKTRRSIIVDDVFHSPHVSPRLAALYPIRSCLGIPLIAGDQIVGAVIIGFHTPHYFTQDEVRRAEQAADQMALAVANGQLLAHLEQARRVAEEASQLKSEFLANTSHELRTPLNGILGSLKLVIDQLCDSPEEERAMVTTAYNASRKLLVIIDDLLNIARIEAGKMVIEPQAIELGAILDEVYDLTRAQAEQKPIALTLHRPPTPSDLRAWADPDKVRQILLNLVGNAIKFTEHGQITITARADLTNNMVLVSVQDTGVGIAPEAQAKLFQPFVQADGSTTRRYGGTGLGLSISRQLAEKMGGTITLYSAGPNQGSTFTLALPVRRPTGELEATPA